MSGPELMRGIVGTTAAKVAAFTLDGRLVSGHATGYPINRPRPGWADQDPLDWWRGCASAPSFPGSRLARCGRSGS
jgi:xylulokinase